MNARKLLLNEKVEVRQIEEGLKGSWHSALVVGISDMSREVEYDELLSETEDSKLVESIPVTGEIEGVYQRPCVKTNHRGRIRPLPSRRKAVAVKDRLSYGFCVDVLFEDAWWEGIVFDRNDGSDERIIFFPDEGDERSFKVSNLHVTRDWDEFSGAWRERGLWTLVKLIEECKTSISLAKFTKLVWSELRINYGFRKMIAEWTCGAHSVWKTYFTEVVSIITTKSVQRPITSQAAAAPDKDVNASSKTKRNSRCNQLAESKHYSPSEADKIYSFDNGGANGSSTQTDASSKKSDQVELSQASDDHCGVTSNTCSMGISERAEDVATTSGCLVQNSKKQSQIVLSRRKMQKVENNLVLQKRKSLARKQQLIRFQSNSPRKPKNVVAGLCSRSHGNSTRHFIQRQKEESLVARYPKSNLRVLSFRIRKKRSCLKVKKRFPKKIQRFNAKNKLSYSKEGSLSELPQKDHSSLDPKATSQQEFKSNEAVTVEKQRSKKSRRNDPVCFVCHYGDDLLPCDNCTSSYHKTCIGLEELPGAKWYCPSCRCGLCGLRNSSEDELFTEVCYQCSRQYHRECLSSTDISVSEESLPEKFCSKRCFQICVRLHEHLQTLHPIPVEGLCWTIARSRRNDYNFHDERIHPCVQLSQVMKVLHECFEPTIEPQTKKDLVSEVVYNSSSKFKRLDFHGFYVMVIQHGEELACVATLRVHGHKVAEMPLIATPFKYRRKGMCRLLMQEMEKMLIELGVERLVLPAISQLRETWVNVFDFEEMPDPLRHELSAYPFLVFSGTTMFHKVLSESTLTNYPSLVQRGNKTITAVVSQESENDKERRYPSCNKRKRRDGIISKDYREAIQCLNYNRGRTRTVTCDKENVTKQGLYYTRRGRGEAGFGRERLTKKGTYRNSSPIKYVYKRRRVLATRECVH